MPSRGSLRSLKGQHLLRRYKPWLQSCAGGGCSAPKFLCWRWMLWCPPFLLHCHPRFLLQHAQGSCCTAGACSAPHEASDPVSLVVDPLVPDPAPVHPAPLAPVPVPEEVPDCQTIAPLPLMEVEEELLPQIHRESLWLQPRGCMLPLWHLPLAHWGSIRLPSPPLLCLPAS